MLKIIVTATVILIMVSILVAIQRSTAAPASSKPEWVQAFCVDPAGYAKKHQGAANQFDIAYERGYVRFEDEHKTYLYSSHACSIVSSK